MEGKTGHLYKVKWKDTVRERDIFKVGEIQGKLKKKDKERNVQIVIWMRKENRIGESERLFFIIAGGLRDTRSNADGEEKRM